MVEGRLNIWRSRRLEEVLYGGGWTKHMEEWETGGGAMWWRVD